MDGGGMKAILLLLPLGLHNRVLERGLEADRLLITVVSHFLNSFHFKNSAHFPQEVLHDL